MTRMYGCMKSHLTKSEENAKYEFQELAKIGSFHSGDGGEHIEGLQCRDERFSGEASLIEVKL